VTWLILAGRGWGKTRTGAEAIRRAVFELGYQRIALVAATAADTRDVMVEGESGLLNIGSPDERPLYESSKRRLTWPNGAIATLYSAEESDRLRGPQHDFAWCDEIATWKNPDTWDMLLFGLRLGDDPRVVVTTTPRPTKIVKELLADSTCVVTRGTTYENRDNLAPTFYSKIVRRYEGTRLGRQELLAEVLTDTPGALWTYELLDACRVHELPDLVRVVVAIDPAVTANEESDETGIIAAGIGSDGHGYVFGDESDIYAPVEWARAAIKLYREHFADLIVAEVNNGGDMVGFTVATVDPHANFKAVRASRGKYTRAEPIAALYEQGFIHHVGDLAKLEDQLCTWVPGADSPDRLDVAVWALTELFLEGEDDTRVVYEDRVSISPY